ncbi:MAG: hypothetical protein H6Q55_139 [Deltaproteobacteria bacterium]|nr:hypothetical protein [Deltaproteobacteria bacterium]
MHEEEVRPCPEYSALELGELASSVSRLLMACSGAKQGHRQLVMDPHDQFLLQNATQVVEDTLNGLQFLAAGDRLAPRSDKIMLCNFLVRMVMHKEMGTGTELRSIKDIKVYFEGLLSVLRKARDPVTNAVTERELAIAQRFFLELASALPMQPSEDETKMTIAMDEVLLRELKRVAQEEGIPVHRLVAEIILSHLNNSKMTTVANSARR